MFTALKKEIWKVSDILN